ncbi:MAG: Coenzyme F420 hydrogenase/dehydrogenase, beta subunit C-terminal domain [Dehalococcoidia bacterium]
MADGKQAGDDRYDGRGQEMGLEVKGCRELQSEVLARDLCTLCGACVGMCPYLVAYRGRIVALDECNLSQGRCYVFCPRTSLDLDLLSHAVFGAAYPADELGVLQQVAMARAGDEGIRPRAQYGGTVTALVCFALEQGLIDSAVLTASDESALPNGTLAASPAQVCDCAGSNFVAAPTLAAFNREAEKDDIQRIGVVATPCQALALAKMRASPLENRNNIDKLKLVIGLFCTWALRYEDFARFLAGKVPLGQIAKFDIPPPPANIFQVFTDSRRIDIPLDEVRPFVRPTCDVCLDMTAEFADISVGAAEGIEGWNTLIVRSDAGRELVELARARGVIELKALPEQNLGHLKEASLLKKKRGLRKVIETSGSEQDLLYLRLASEAVKGLLS